MKIKIEPNWHQAIVGMTGSGKTTLTRLMIAHYASLLNFSKMPSYYQIFILDTKHEGDFDGLGKKYYDLRDVARDQTSRVVIFEPSEEWDDPAGYEWFLRIIWDRWMLPTGKTEKRRVPFVCVIDELTSLAISRNNKSYIDEKGKKHVWSEIMKRGRSSNGVLWNGTQNPVNVPEDFLRNASSFFAFRLNQQADRDKMAQFMGDQVRGEISDLHGFWYKTVKMPEPIYVPKLRLPENF